MWPIIRVILQTLAWLAAIFGAIVIIYNPFKNGEPPQRPLDNLRCEIQIPEPVFIRDIDHLVRAWPYTVGCTFRGTSAIEVRGGPFF